MVPANLLGPDNAWIFRITHKDNIPLLAQKGLVASNFAAEPDAYIPIGLSELTEKRRQRYLPGKSGRRLGDYVPFYFTPNTPMLLNILTGQHELTPQPKHEIAILIGNLRSIADAGYEIAFTDRQAYLRYAKVRSDLAELGYLIDWEILRRNDYRYSPDDPEKMERYQAEGLVYRHIPFNMLDGIGTGTPDAQTEVQDMLAHAGSTLEVVCRPNWYPR